MIDINFGTNLRNLVESFGIETPNIEIVQIGDSKISLNMKGANSDIEAILESLKSPPSDFELQTLEKDGIEIKFENGEGCAPYSKDIITTDNGLFFKGRRVVLHIAEAYYENSKLTEASQLHKYHLHFCQALQDQKAKGNLEKYRISLSKDGKFHYVFKKNKGGIIKGQRLNVCTNCLRDFYSKEKRVSDFDLDKFLNSQTKTVQNGDSPKFLFDGLNLEGMDFDYNSISSEYHKNWREKSIARKKAENYTCQECGWKPLKDKNRRFIHTHHLDKNKSNNLSSNLKVLCIKCHFQYHPTLKYITDYKKFDNEKSYDSKFLYSKQGFVTHISQDRDKNDKDRKFIQIDNNLQSLIYSNRKIYDEVKIGSKVEYIEKEFKGKLEADILEIL